MNIIRIENVKSSLATTYSLTLNVEKHKDLNKLSVAVILNEDDVDNINTIIKLKGLNIDYLIIPKKLKFTFNDTEYYKIIASQLTKDYKISYY